MALITRVSRLFQADFHAVLDRIEEPDVLLRQAVREMEEELARDEQRSKLLQHELRQLINRATDLDTVICTILKRNSTPVSTPVMTTSPAPASGASLRHNASGKFLPASARRSRKRSMISIPGSGKTRCAWPACGRRPNCWPGKTPAPGPKTTGPFRISPSARRMWKWPFCVKNSTGAGHETTHLP